MLRSVCSWGNLFRNIGNASCLRSGCTTLLKRCFDAKNILKVERCAVLAGLFVSLFSG
jgi:hypothetical protein